jgi:hypothetical protein
MGRKRIPAYPDDISRWNEDEWFSDDPFRFAPRLRHEPHHSSRKGSQRRRGHARRSRKHGQQGGWGPYSHH